MAEVMKAHTWKGCLLQQGPERSAQEVACFDGLTDFVGKDEALILPDRPEA